MAALEGPRTGLKPAAPLVRRILLLLGIPSLVTAVLLSLPMPELDDFLSDPAGTRITDRTGTLLAVVPGPGGAFQMRVGPGGIPAECAEIFIGLEDSRFRRHPGVDPFAVLRALVDRVTSPAARSGASTITMQLARLVEPRARSVAGKIEEAWWALRIESRLTKDRILAAYLDAVPFGRNTRGVGAAAWTYFGTDLAHLSRSQILSLAIIPRNPTVYDPFDHPEHLIAAGRALEARIHLGISPEELEAAVRGVHGARPPADAPHFSRYVQGELLAGRLHAAGGVLRTTLDLGLNHDIEARIRFIIARYINARVTNAAVVAIDNATGAVIGWVGSRDFSDAEHSGQVDGALIRRQSASTLKPFLYARAIEKGWTAATLLPDVPVIFGAADDESYRPQNFDKRSHGVVRLRTALASSLNVPAVYSLSRLGLPEFLRTLDDLGFALPRDSAARYGLGTAIGNAEVSLVELVHAFSVFPRGGALPALVLAEGAAPEVRRVFDPFSSWMICNILSDPSARATGFGTRTYFRTNVPAMFKSGTSSEFTNLWCIGATPRFTVGAWAGNFDGRAVINKTGSIVPTQIVSDILTRLSEKHPLPPASRDFAAPAGVVAVRICTETGLRATPACDSTRTEYFRNAAEVPPPDIHPDQHNGDSLLLSSLLEKGEEMRIVFPVNGQVFYLDETLRAGTQAIPVSIAARNDGDVTVTVDSRRVAPGPQLSGIRVPLTRGSHLVVAQGSLGGDRVHFEVK
ncbi:MAG: transglycosylase domain-containing protein [Spirochaetia bacterium]|jgi:penicillin-binding protein 1C